MKTIQTITSFCCCIADAETADPAGRGFCAWVESGSARNITGDDLAQLKKALMDPEDGQEAPGFRRSSGSR